MLKLLGLFLAAVVATTGVIWHTDTRIEQSETRLGANQKISELTAQTTLDDSDYFVTVDNSGTPTTKRITVANATSSLKTFFDGLYEAELDNSAGLLAALDDETGTGVAVFGTSPTISGAILTTTTLTSPTINTSFLGTAVLGISQGGTGSTTKSSALNALLPTQTGNSGKALTTDGTNATFTGAVAPTPGVVASSSPLLTDASGNLSWGNAISEQLLCNVAATSSSNSRFTCDVPSRKFYRVVWSVASSTAENSTMYLQFNTDVGSNYTTKVSADGGAASLNTTSIGMLIAAGGGGAVTQSHGSASCWNETTSLKMCQGTAIIHGTTLYETAMSYNSSTSTTISTIGFLNSSGNFGYGTRFRIFASPD